MNTQLKRILCIDDDNDILQIEKFALETTGRFEVLLCSDSKLAPQQIKESKPDLILLDLMMPEMDGLSILKTLADNALLEHIPVIFITAKIQPADVAHYLALGVAGVIEKPFDPLLLSQQITTLWNQRLEATQSHATQSKEKTNLLTNFYLTKLQDQLQTLRAILTHCQQGALAEQDLQFLKNQAHKLAGSGGTYGFNQISITAKKLTQSLQENNLNCLATDLQQLIIACAEASKSQLQIKTIANSALMNTKSTLPQLILLGESRVTQQALAQHLANEVTILTASTLEETLILLHEHSINLMIIGDRIPRKSALELLETLKKTPTLTETPTIILTANSQLDEMLSFIAAGAIDYITQPFSSISLSNKIRERIKWQRTTILIADDDETIRELLGHKFRAAGFNVILAQDGDQAFELIKQHSPKLIILDQMMPGLDGIALLQKLRADPRFSDTPALFLTAKRQEEDILESFRLGAQDYIVKPFMPDEVIARCLRLLEKTEKKSP